MTANITGTSPRLQPKGTAGSGILTARFEVVTPTQFLSGDDATYIKWIAPANDDITWDDIGFSDDYTFAGGEFFVPSDGEYEIICFAKLIATTAFTVGDAALDLETSGDGAVEEQDTRPVSLNTGTNLEVMGTHRKRAAAFQPFQISIHTFGCDDTSGVGPASIWIAKLKSI